MFKKSSSLLYSKLLYKLGQHFLDRHFCRWKVSKGTNIFSAHFKRWNPVPISWIRIHNTQPFNRGFGLFPVDSEGCRCHAQTEREVWLRYERGLQVSCTCFFSGTCTVYTVHYVRVVLTNFVLGLAISKKWSRFLEHTVVCFIVLLVHFHCWIQSKSRKN